MTKTDVLYGNMKGRLFGMTLWHISCLHTGFWTALLGGHEVIIFRSEVGKYTISDILGSSSPFLIQCIPSLLLFNDM